MRNIAIWGFGESGKKLYQIIKSKTKDNVVCFVDNDISKLGEKKDNATVISIYKLIEYYFNKKIDSILIPAIYINDTVKLIIKQLKDYKIKDEDIYTVPIHIFLNESLDDNDIEAIYTYYCDLKQLEGIEFHVANHCNLNCKRCDHFSNLVKEESFVEFKQFKKDINRLKELIPDIRMVKLLGGEPLLNKDLHLFIEEARKVYPYTELVIVTNGLLVKSMNSRLIASIKNNNVLICITLYPPIEKSIDDLVAFLKNNNIRFYTYRIGDCFYSPINIRGNSDIEKVTKNCVEACTIVHEGKIARCSLGIFIKEFNKYFNVNLPENGYIDLYQEELTGKELIKLIRKPIDMCKFCYRNYKYKWEQSTNAINIKDYTS